MDKSWKDNHYLVSAGKKQKKTCHVNIFSFSYDIPYFLSTHIPLVKAGHIAVSKVHSEAKYRKYTPAKD